MKTRREFHEDEFHEDDDDERDRRTIPDGYGVRVPLMFADEAPPVTWVRGRSLRDSVPEPVFDARWHQPGYRTFEMVRDAVNALRLDDAAGDSVEAARQQRIASQGRAWRDGMTVNVNYNVPQSSQEAGGGQVRGGPRVQTLAKRPVPGGGQPSGNGDDETLTAEEARVAQTYGWEYPDDKDVDDAAAAYAGKQKRLADAWRSPVQSSAEARLTDTMRPVTAPVADRRGTPIRDRESAYQAKCWAQENAWKVPA